MSMICGERCVTVSCLIFLASSFRVSFSAHSLWVNADGEGVLPVIRLLGGVNVRQGFLGACGAKNFR
jgi:hypothetical protein